MCVQQMHLEELEKDLQYAFDLFDKDGNGVVSPEEIRYVMKALGHTVPLREIEVMVEEADPSGDGFLSIDEFKQVMIYRKELDPDY